MHSKNLPLGTDCYEIIEIKESIGNIFTYLGSIEHVQNIEYFVVKITVFNGSMRFSFKKIIFRFRS